MTRNVLTAPAAAAPDAALPATEDVDDDHIGTEPALDPKDVKHINLNSERPDTEPINADWPEVELKDFLMAVGATLTFYCTFVGAFKAFEWYRGGWNNRDCWAIEVDRAISLCTRIILPFWMAYRLAARFDRMVAKWTCVMFALGLGYCIAVEIVGELRG